MVLRRAPLALAAVLVLVAVLLAGCGDGSPDAASPPTTSTTSTTTVVDDPGGGGEFATTPVTMPPAGRGLLQDVRTGVHGGFVRVTFEFDAPPGYRVEHTARPITQDGSGDEVNVAGDGAILVNLQPASSFDLDTSTPTYTGPKRIAIPASSVVREVVFVGDFEAVLSWAIGTDGDRPFRVFTLDAPPRVVVDVQAPRTTE